MLLCCNFGVVFLMWVFYAVCCSYVLVCCFYWFVVLFVGLWFWVLRFVGFGLDCLFGLTLGRVVCACICGLRWYLGWLALFVLGYGFVYFSLIIVICVCFIVVTMSFACIMFNCLNWLIVWLVCSSFLLICW